MIKRNMEVRGNRFLELFSVLVILGPRQCGKTILSRQLRPEWRYFDMENSSDYDLITNDYSLFFREYKEHLIIDEAQQTPGLFKELRGIVDQQRDMKNRFILTGSSSPELLKKISETLAGRAGVIELGTLSLNEIHEIGLSPLFDIIGKGINSRTIDLLKTLSLRYSHQDTMDCFLRGGYPEPVLHEDELFHPIWMGQYHNTYLQRDIRRLFPRLDLVRYRRFIGMLSSLNGTIINRSELGRSLDTSETTIKEYLDIAEGSFLWRNIKSYEHSVSRSIVKRPKGYFRDSGLSSWLRQISNRDQLLLHPGVGSAFEAFVSEELIKGFSCSNYSHMDFSYYRTRNGAEIDLIIQGDFGILPVEIKMGTHVKPGALRWMKEFLLRNDIPLGIVINNSNRVVKLTDNIMQLPVSVL